MKANLFTRFTYLMISLLVAISQGIAKPATIMLKNGHVINGDIREESSEYVVLLSDIGEVKVQRHDIERIIYDAFTSFQGDTAAEGAETFHDRVVVHTEEGDIIDGFILAKSRSMIMLQTDIGRLTIPKKDVRFIEYLTNAYSEQGEKVIINLNNGTKVEGYIYHEDRSSLTVMSKLGRLSIDKENLKSVEYPRDKKFDFPQMGIATEFAQQRPVPASLEAWISQPRRDVIEMGYSNRFGNTYSPGMTAGYRSRFMLKAYPTFSLMAEGRVNISLFSLDKKAFSNAGVPAAVTATGGAFITTIGAALPVHFYPRKESKHPYKFFCAPALESHIVHKRLKQEFPSYPSLNSEVTETDFRFGVGGQVGLDYIFGEWGAGLSYTIHVLFGENDFNHFSLHIVRNFF